MPLVRSHFGSSHFGSSQFALICSYGPLVWPMTRSLLTVRTGATVTHVHCKDMAAMWMTHLIAAASHRSHADVQGHIAKPAPSDILTDEPFPMVLKQVEETTIPSPASPGPGSSMTTSHSGGLNSTTACRPGQVVKLPPHAGPIEQPTQPPRPKASMTDSRPSRPAVEM